MTRTTSQSPLRDFQGTPVVLVFYPLDWSPTCSDQLSLYQAEPAEFARFGATVVGISVDSIYSHGAWAAVRGLTFPLLADFEPKAEIARRYNVYRERDGFSERALYVVDDGGGVIRYAHVSPRLEHIPDIYELFRVLAELTGETPAAPAAEQVAPMAVVGAGRGGGSMVLARNGYGVGSAPSPAPVVVHGTRWCAASQMVRRHLDRLGIPYRYGRPRPGRWPG